MTESDLIMGGGNRSVIGTLVERHSGFLVLLHLPASHDSGALRDVLQVALAAIPGQIGKTLTCDQGSEMARHHEFAYSFVGIRPQKQKPRARPTWAKDELAPQAA